MRARAAQAERQGLHIHCHAGCSTCCGISGELLSSRVAAHRGVSQAARADGSQSGVSGGVPFVARADRRAARAGNGGVLVGSASALRRASPSSLSQGDSLRVSRRGAAAFTRYDRSAVAMPTRSIPQHTAVPIPRTDDPRRPSSLYRCRGCFGARTSSFTPRPQRQESRAPRPKVGVRRSLRATD